MWVFISYAAEDRDLAEQTHLALTGAGHQTFFDRESLPAGGDFYSAIRAAVQKSDLFVFLISPDSINSGSFALTELQYARMKWRHPLGHVLPVMARPTEWGSIPNYLKAVTVLEPVGNVPAEVLAALSGLPSPRDEPPPPKPATAKATAWAIILVMAFAGAAGTVIAYRDKLFGPPAPATGTAPATEAVPYSKAIYGGVTLRSGLGETDSIYWEKNTDEGDYLIFKDNFFTGTTNKGLIFRIQGPLPLVRRRQGKTATWLGNFNQGDGVLSTDHDIGPLIIVFYHPIKGAGAQIQAESQGRFKGRIEAFDVEGGRLAQYDREGSSDPTNDNSAIFLGVLFKTAKIKTIKFSTFATVPSPRSTSFGINRVSLNY